MSTTKTRALDPQQEHGSRIRAPAGERCSCRSSTSRSGSQLILGVPGDQVGTGDRNGGRHLPCDDGHQRDLVRQPVDHYRKKTMMQASSLVSLAFYGVAPLGPYADAAEQTIPQTVVPYEGQGRVLSFTQSIEEAASTLTAFPRS